MKYFVYSIKSLTKNYIYVGLTNNVKRRFSQHNNGQEKTTRFYASFRIRMLLVESFSTRIEARKREKYLKSGIGKEFLKSLV
ncbi:endonuclease [Candidatus Nomurabacteria bacterium RIFCSPHIGHO2_01_FULL_39_220]|uniref:Endonuclease n=1 Tax=Candidatus Nomurabacteria bacterium RIFCSPLOWO2_02_FULL_40_67 TaxID=1801787 RepID=A0A1F6Y579_9BACT|nr:MAG: GIY-YIG domain protein [Parcubacteria group bacterium GW2011_GWA2_40_37]KKS73064.1 MAG: GIY-YIG domain protein [Parcubacteria group bacterium GW2011_GWF2_42_7]OGI61692.1 MAG: endonuclease [Candidatus Nomurabacteria bacterium RBG_16_40_11]OGI69955.1 MAG: endonuclease [Candidatus Nomurabacteria bacterium RIFCSPHIGHO2_01_FULL_39_220]OGI73426.1 MAG: endonuclease [Candidatus Nomurabacteria bacterium RIFCSPHIGHO2_02_41_18]OGI78527.1 MAG: endonuclease [Candidatus Nomurabacteria bacterium RIFC